MHYGFCLTCKSGHSQGPLLLWCSVWLRGDDVVYRGGRNVNAFQAYLLSILCGCASQERSELTQNYTENYTETTWWQTWIEKKISVWHFVLTSRRQIIAWLFSALGICLQNEHQRNQWFGKREEDQKMKENRDRGWQILLRWPYCVCRNTQTWWQGKDEDIEVSCRA